MSKTSADSPPRHRQFLRINAVVEATGLPPSSVYAAMADGTFPKSIPISPRSRAWDADEVLAWQEACIAGREKA
jgi:prophage regulatory protein